MTDMPGGAEVPFQQQFTAPEIPAQCAGCPTMCALKHNIDVYQGRIDEEFALADQLEGILADDPSLRSTLLRDSQVYIDNVRNGTQVEGTRNLQIMTAENIERYSAGCDGPTRWRKECTAGFTYRPMETKDPHRWADRLETGLQAVGVVVAIASVIAVARTHDWTPDEGPVKAPIDYSQDYKNNTAVKNTTVESPIGELVVEDMKVQDPEEMAEKYIKDNPDAKGVYIGVFNKVTIDGKQVNHGGYAYTAYSPDVKDGNDEQEVNMKAWEALPEDVLMQDTMSWDPSVTLDPNQRILFQVVGKDGSVETKWLPISFKPTFECDEQISVVSANELAPRTRQEICAAAAIMQPFQGGEKMNLVIYNAYEVDGPMASGPFYSRSGDHVAMTAPFDPEAANDQWAVSHEFTHDVFDSLPPEEQAQLKAAFELMYNASGATNRAAVLLRDADQVWKPLTEKTYYCLSGITCESGAGHPYDDSKTVAGNELFASTASVLTELGAKHYLGEYKKLNTQERMANAAAVAATLHALYTTNQDLGAFDKTFPGWRKTITTLAEDVHNTPDRPDSDIYDDLFFLADLAK
jgi:hypothetical protein